MTDRSILRWGGLAGIVAVLMNLLSFVAGFFAPPLFVPTPPFPTCGPPCYVDAALPGFPGAKAAIVAENAFYLAAIILLVMFFLALYKALGTTNISPPAMFGTGLSLLGLSMEFVGALPSVAFAHLSEIYQATPGDTGIIQISHAVQAIFNATDTIGGILLATGFILFGTAMFQNSTIFGKKFGSATIALSLAALVGIGIVSIGMDNPNDPFFVILLLLLPLILGLYLYRLSRAKTAQSAVP